MTSSEAITVEAVETGAYPEPKSPSGAPVMPGTSMMGTGVDVFGEYCGPGFFGQPILDLTDRGKEVESSDFVTSDLLTVTEERAGTAEEIRAETKREFSQSFSSRVGLEGKSGYFSGELDASFSGSISQQVDTTLVQYNDQRYYWQLLLPPSKDLIGSLLPSVRDNFNGDMSADELVRTYGTHYVGKALVGARSSFCAMVNMSTFESKKDVSATVKLAYQGLSSRGSGEASHEQKEAMNAMSKSASYSARVLGGDPKFVKTILNGDYMGWVDSVPDNMRIVDVKGGLRRISELVTDRAFRSKVEDAIQMRLEAHDLPPEPDLARVVAWHTYVGGSRWYYAIDGQEEMPASFSAQYNVFYAFTKPGDGRVPIYRSKKVSSKNSSTIYRLSRDNGNNDGWMPEGIAFYAYTTPGAKSENRIKIHSFREAKEPKEHGWHYVSTSQVKGWSLDDRNSFFVPNGPHR